MSPRVVRRLTLALGAVYAVLGTLEVVLKVADESEFATIAFFGGTLLGGAALIFVGLFSKLPEPTRRVLILLGAAAGLLASMWTLIVPILAITVIATNVGRPGEAR